MFTNDELSRECIFVTSRDRLIAKPPAREDIISMKRWCSKIRRTENIARKWCFSCLFIAPLVISSAYVSWSTLLLMLILAVVLYCAVVFMIPHVIRLFVKVSFKVNETEMIDPMNERLFGKLDSPISEFATHLDALQYCKNLEKTHREATVFDKYIVFLLNERASEIDPMHRAGLNA